MKILGIDPGGTTGLVIYDAARECCEMWTEEPDQLALCTLTWDLLNPREDEPPVVDAVVIERWVTMRGRSFTHEPNAAEIIGAVRWQASYTGVTLALQNAADAKRWGTRTRLAPHRESGVGRGAAGHALMALSHALLYAAKMRGGVRYDPGTEDTDTSR